MTVGEKIELIAFKKGFRDRSLAAIEDMNKLIKILLKVEREGSLAMHEQKLARQLARVLLTTRELEKLVGDGKISYMLKAFLNADLRSIGEIE